MKSEADLFCGCWGTKNKQNKHGDRAPKTGPGANRRVGRARGGDLHTNRERFQE